MAAVPASVCDDDLKSSRVGRRFGRPRSGKARPVDQDLVYRVIWNGVATPTLPRVCKSVRTIERSDWLDSDRTGSRSSDDPRR